MSQGYTKGVPIDTDTLLTLNSDLLVPSQKAVKAYVQAYQGSSNNAAALGGIPAASYALKTDVNLSYDSANSAWIQANTARTGANTVGGYANSAFASANAGFAQANTARDSANTVGGYANSAFAMANTAGTDAVNAFAKANTAGTDAVNAFTQANTARTASNTVGGYANSAFATANLAFAQANAAFAEANTSVQNNTTTLITAGYTVSPFSAGANVAAYGTWQPNAANSNYQYATCNGALTITTPPADCAIDILFINPSGTRNPGTLTFSGYSVGTIPGVAYANTAGNKYILSIRRINATSTYSWYPLQ